LEEIYPFLKISFFSRQTASVKKKIVSFSRNSNSNDWKLHRHTQERSVIQLGPQSQQVAFVVNTDNR